MRVRSSALLYDKRTGKGGVGGCGQIETGYGGHMGYATASVLVLVSRARPHPPQAKGEGLVKSLHTSRAPGMR